MDRVAARTFSARIRDFERIFRMTEAAQGGRNVATKLFTRDLHFLLDTYRSRLYNPSILAHEGRLLEAIL
jgi:hypothetical protein